MGYPVSGFNIAKKKEQVDMTSSVFTKKYDVFRQLLIKARKDQKLTQQNLAKTLLKPQSFISKYESGERRLDLIEFIEVANALKINKSEFIRQIEGEENNDE